MRGSSLALALALIVTGCKGRDRGAATAPQTPTAAVTSGGPQPIVSLAVWPARWSTIAALPQLRALGGEVPSSFWLAAKQLTGEVGLRELALPPPGVDESGPVTLEISRPHATFETVGLAAAKGTPLAPEDRVALRVRVTFAATDSAALAGALDAAIAGRSKDKRPELRVVRGQRAVALDVYLDDAPVGQIAVPPAAIALPFDAGHESAARAALRLQGLGDLAATIGMSRAANALASDDSPERALLLAGATSEVLTGYLLVDPATSVTDAAFADIPANGAPQVAFALTAAGKAVLSQGGLAQGKTLAFDAVRWPAAIAAAPHVPLLDTGERGSTGVAMLFHQCGAFCFAWVAMGNGVVLAPALGINDAEQLKAALSQAGIPAAELAWTTNGLASVLPKGATPPAWASVATGAVAQSAAEACYRKALLVARNALHESDLSHLRDADAAIEGAASCAAADPEIAARQRAMRELLVAIRAMPAPPRR